MSGNFGFLAEKKDTYDLFAQACIEAEDIYATSPALCAVGCRKALELAVRWVYAADDTVQMPFKDNLASLLHNDTFRNLVDSRVWRPLIFVNKLGNLAVHTNKRISAQDAVQSLRALFEFVDWIRYCYGSTYEQRRFDEGKIPTSTLELSSKEIKEIKARESIAASDTENEEKQEKAVSKESASLTAARKANTKTRSFDAEEPSEWETRKRYIDVDLALAGWTLGKDALFERKVYGMPIEPGDNSGTGYADYVLLGKDGKPLALIEAKRTRLSADKGEQQACLYADCLEKEYGYRPLVFLSNGFETFFLDDKVAPKRLVSGVFSQEDLARLMERKHRNIDLGSALVNKDIAGRYYQIRAIKKICCNIDSGHRGSLIVMPCGTGKTRTAAGLVDVLMRAGLVKNTLFLADRTALVAQAKYAFQQYLPNTSLCNLCKSRSDSTARIVFTTYPTILNAVDAVKTEDGARIYTPAHFDLIIVDEAHRSIFKKYRAIFDYFDAYMVGLTATPAAEVDRNTYDAFGVQQGIPTDVYPYKDALEDGYLVDYYGIETHTDFIDKGIRYDDLSAEEKERIEEDYEDAGEERPDYVPPTELNTWLFNEATVDSVLETLMDYGLRTDGGQNLGKTIIFAQNKKHAKFIEERFAALYPHLPADYIKRVLHGEDYSQTIIDEFKKKAHPVITISVDMMDTGVDVPGVLNLVVFKRVKSRIKFTQMLGRGTRTCDGLNVVDPYDHKDAEYYGKRRFVVFDWCKNFEYFRLGGDIKDQGLPRSLAEAVFCRQVQLVHEFQPVQYAGDEWQSWRQDLVKTLRTQVCALDTERAKVRLQLQYVEKFKSENAWTTIDKTGLSELQRKVAPLVENSEKDVYALRFDALMYGYMCNLFADIEIEQYQRQVSRSAKGLLQKTTIPQVKNAIPLLQKAADKKILAEMAPLELEEVRKGMRDLIRFLADGDGRNPVYTDVSDPRTKIAFGVSADFTEDFTDYEDKVKHWIVEYGDSTVIHKLHHNLPMTLVEYNELGRVFTEELGTEEDYHRSFGDKGFGLLVRRVVKLDRKAADDAFADFINEHNLSDQQISFVETVVTYCSNNGYMEPGELLHPPFDNPRPFLTLFDSEQQSELVGVIKRIKLNAEKPAA